MSADGIEITGYEPALREGLLDLQSLLWGPDRAANAAYFRWKYLENPWAPEPRLSLAVHARRVVGMRGAWGGPWACGAAPVPRAMCAGDLVIDPALRGRGLLTRILEHMRGELARDGVAWLFNLSAGPATRLGSLAAGWGSTEPIERMTRPRPRTVRNLVEGVAAQGGREPFASLDAYWRDRHDGLELSAEPRSGAMAALVRQLSDDGRIHESRDEAFFAWRFRNPRARYRFLFAGGTQLEGYLVLQHRVPAQGGFLRLVDLVATTAEARAHLVAAAMECPAIGAVEAWTGSLDASDRDAFARTGFVAEPATSLGGQYVSILVTSTEGAAPPWRFGGRDLLDIASWNVQLLDSDVS